MKIGFIGAGNMATAIIKGAISSGNFNSADIFAYDINTEKLATLADELSINSMVTTESLITAVDVVVLAVKPNVIADVLRKNNEYLQKLNPLIISIAAGKTIEFIASNLDYNASIVRVMPNINATVNEAMSAYCFNRFVSGEQKEIAEKLCASFGKVMCISENYFPLFGVVAGCAPAFVYMFIDSLARAAVKNGMNKANALQIAAQTVFGSAKQILESDTHPWELVDRVCSPGGTTIEGVASLQASGFEATIAKAVDASLNKDIRI